MEKKSSIFSALGQSQAQGPFHKGPDPATGSGVVRQESDAKIAALEAAIRALQAEVAALKQSVVRPPPPPPPSARPDIIQRVERSEAGLADIRAGLEACAAQTKSLETQVSRNEGDLLPRMVRCEAGLTGLKAVVESCQASANRLEAYIARNDVERVGLNVSEAIAEFETMRRKLSEYNDGFAAIEQECRKSLGEMRGHLKNVSEKLLADRFDDHLRQSLSRLSPKIAELEKMFHEGLADISSRLMSDEVLYGKILSESEHKLRKGLEPDISGIKGQLKVLGERITWLSDEQNIVNDRRLRALEAKASALDAIMARMDTLEGERTADAKGEGRPGNGKGR
ncbi:MAG TPA: hypothetical protein PL037_01570 [Elusimicrobiales bacterium]|nr:hypothetical protein [Elusimicrobiales bacterium]